MVEGASKEEHVISCISETHETCWGCGLRLLLTSYSPVFKCGWCGAITYKNKIARKPDSVWFSRWRCFRDRFFLTVLLFFMLFVICAGIWAVHPVVFSISFLFGVLHITIVAILSISAISFVFLAAFMSAGAPPSILWGSYSVVVKGGLENYTFCEYCLKPKPPRAHHCRSCRMCVLDMDHHCPFIGNCVGAANHRYFILFLISVVISCAYVVLMTVYAGLHVWPPLNLDRRGLINVSTMSLLKQIMAAFASSAFLLSARGLVLIYLAFASASVDIGLTALLWQQLYYMYEGKTYINHISPQNGQHGERGCQNILRFFGCPYSVFRLLLPPANATKRQEASCSKLL